MIIFRYQFNTDRSITAITLETDGTQTSSTVTIGPTGTYYRVNGYIALNSETDYKVDIQIKDGPLLQNIPKGDYRTIDNLGDFE